MQYVCPGIRISATGSALWPAKLPSQATSSKHNIPEHSDLYFKIGDMAWLSSEHIAIKSIGSRKMLALWIGPFKVTAKVGPVNYTLDIPEHYRIHMAYLVSMLRLTHDNGSGNRTPPILMIQGQEEFELEEILAHRPLHKQKGDSVEIWEHLGEFSQGIHEQG